MSKKAVLEKETILRIGKEPVVIVPLKLWQEMQDRLEDREALASPKFLRRISQGRKASAAGKLISPFR
ncbi:MAG: hypothetical protein EXQ56_09760 [Acidobacteria bacterium]|nr:hypothetical protein [Acidobacteriota bacterium]